MNLRCSWRNKPIVSWKMNMVPQSPSFFRGYKNGISGFIGIGLQRPYHIQKILPFPSSGSELVQTVPVLSVLLPRWNMGLSNPVGNAASVFAWRKRNGQSWSLFSCAEGHEISGRNGKKEDYLHPNKIQQSPRGATSLLIAISNSFCRLSLGRRCRIH